MKRFTLSFFYIMCYFFCIFFTSKINAQNIGINSTGATPNTSAGLDIDFTNKGLLIPRVALTMTTAAGPITAPSTSLLVYNTATVADVTPGFYFWDGVTWTPFVTGSAWTTSGNSGIGVANFIGTINAADFITRTTNIERMRITAAGNIGIGTATPAESFSVSKTQAGWQSRFNNNSGTGADVYLAHGNGYGMHVRSWNSSDAIYTIDMYNNTSRTNTFYNSGRVALGMVGNVGIATDVPYAKLHVVGYTVFSATNTAFSAGTSAAYIRGNDAFSTATTPDYTWYNSSQTGFFHPAATVIGFCVNGYGEVMRINNNRLGIGTTTPGGLLELALDQGRKPGTNTWTIVSDERLKTIEGPYKKGLKELMQLNAIVYHYKNAEGRNFPNEVLQTQNIGFSAQEVQKIFPEAVGQDSDGYLNLNTHAILIAYLNALKEQQAEIELLKSENKNYKTELLDLKKEMEEIKIIIKK